MQYCKLTNVKPNNQVREQSNKVRSIDVMIDVHKYQYLLSIIRYLPACLSVCTEYVCLYGVCLLGSRHTSDTFYFSGRGKMERVKLLFEASRNSLFFITATDKLWCSRTFRFPLFFLTFSHLTYCAYQPKPASPFSHPRSSLKIS